MKKDKTRHKYLVGFVGDNQCVYGKDEFDNHFGCNVASLTQPMTLFQAKHQLKALSAKRENHKVVYELKPVEIQK